MVSASWMENGNASCIAMQTGPLCLVTTLGLAGAPMSGDGLYGADANPTGDPIGGGKGYRHILSPDDAEKIRYFLEEREPILYQE